MQQGQLAISAVAAAIALLSLWLSFFVARTKSSADRFVALLQMEADHRRRGPVQGEDAARNATDAYVSTAKDIDAEIRAQTLIYLRKSSLFLGARGTGAAAFMLAYGTILCVIAVMALTAQLPSPSRSSSPAIAEIVNACLLVLGLAMALRGVAIAAARITARSIRIGVGIREPWTREELSTTVQGARRAWARRRGRGGA